VKAMENEIKKPNNKCLVFDFFSLWVYHRCGWIGRLALSIFGLQ